MSDASVAPMNAPFTFSPPGRLIDFMREAGEPGLINLAAGVPGTESLPAQELSEAIARGYATDGAAMFAYHYPDGDTRLRALLAERLRSRSADVKAEQVLTVTGCQQGLQRWRGFVQQAPEKMLGPEIVVIEQGRLAMGELHGTASGCIEAIEQGETLRGRHP